MKLFEMHLPYPPSVNKYYIRSKKNGVILSRVARIYRELVMIVCSQWTGKIIDTPVIAWIELYPPDYRVRDTDNTQKAVFDSLQGAGVIANDKFIVEHHVKMCKKFPPYGIIHVTIFDAKDSEWKKTNL